jgi:hypothetical protein
MRDEMKILVCGGIRYNDNQTLDHKLDSLLALYGEIELISSCARGVDRLTNLWAKSRGVPIQRFPARPDQDGFRVCNLEMLAQSPALVVAFPGGRITAHMIEIAREAGVSVQCGDSTDTPAASSRRPCPHP